MIWQRLGLRYTYKQISAKLSVDCSTVQRTVSLFELTGSLEKRPYPTNRLKKKLTPTVEQIFLLSLVIQKPGILLCELEAVL